MEEIALNLIVNSEKELNDCQELKVFVKVCLQKGNITVEELPDLIVCYKSVIQVSRSIHRSQISII